MHNLTGPLVTIYHVKIDIAVLHAQMAAHAQTLLLYVYVGI